MKRLLLPLLLAITHLCHSQGIISFADSVRQHYKVPELAFAVVSSDSVLECHVLGVRRANTTYAAQPGDRFHIGSNTKAITAFIAALLVQEKKIQWNTTILTLFPELRWRTRYVYDTVTLANLLNFRGRLQGYSYNSERPAFRDLHGDYAAQRMQLAANFLTQAPLKPDKNGLTPSNVDYIMAGLMLEKASGKSYKTLVQELGARLGINFRFDYPNLKDTTQPWGHDENLQPLVPAESYKMNWLLAAGNINVSIEEYTRFVRVLLMGLKGKSDLLPKKTFEQLLFGMPYFSYGWFNPPLPSQHHAAFNEGNAGAFITKVHIVKEADRAYVIFTNAATAATKDAVDVLQRELTRRYGE
ncbi:beta-lactamase family protein [Chitinophaga filiformis]|uniref:serine hydrolase domain-containing protein n=1 Tax=Chitinophaga filiformis TaxID=104663 RepID=UPI001F176912|nr:serine hydrolase domain-containing protein [Chitinophaga filiformis]MCF6404331.1 beta-lactamase family protein [Chitinophaga filiformis]